MKTITCQHCREQFTATTKEVMLNSFYSHYMKDHTEIITNVDESGKKAWMEKFEADWNAAVFSDETK